jgi:virginiamycin B lyase
MSSKSLARAGVTLLVGALLAALSVLVPSPPGALAGGAPFDEFTDPSIDQPRYVTTAADGAVWLTATASDRVGTVRLDGTVVTFANAQVDAPTHITRGPDGAVWFVSSGTDRIGRITTAGTI